MVPLGRAFFSVSFARFAFPFKVRSMLRWLYLSLFFSFYFAPKAGTSVEPFSRIHEKKQPQRFRAMGYFVEVVILYFRFDSEKMS